MSRFVLVHGAFHGAWCWDKVVPLMQANGHTVEAVDLPGHGLDTTPTAEVTVDGYAACLCGILSASDTQAILVGHSAGGVAITQAAEKCPEYIQSLVYLAALLARDGESAAQVGSRPERAGAALSPATVMVSNDRTSLLVPRPEVLREAFYADCSQQDVERAQRLLVPEPVSVGGTPLRMSAERYGRVPRYYIRCTQDRTLPVALQDVMVAASPCRAVFTLETSHSPFFSAPQQLVEILESIAQMTTGA